MTDTHTEGSGPDYADMIGLALYNLKNGAIFDITKNVREENRVKFVDIVKTYIDRNYGHREGWELEFNGDYSKIKKRERPISAQPIKPNDA